ncbi:metallothiol transferase FosB [Aeribacillus pallidus]
MKMYPINHICISVSNLEQSILFYEQVFQAKLLVKGRQTAYFDLKGIWLALNEQPDISREEIYQSYTHIAFSINPEELEKVRNRLNQLGVQLEPGRKRHPRDRKSIYFRDPDGHLYEFHTGTLEERLEYYRDEKPHMTFFE